MENKRKTGWTFSEISYYIGIAASVLLLLCMFLPYIADTPANTLDMLQEYDIPTFGATKESMSLFTYAIGCAYYKKIGIEATDLVYTVLIGILFAFMVIIFFGVVFHKVKVSLIFGILSLGLNLLLVWDFTSRGVVGGFMTADKFGIAMYLMIILPAAIIVLDIIALVSEKPHE